MPTLWPSSKWEIVEHVETSASWKHPPWVSKRIPCQSRYKWHDLCDPSTHREEKRATTPIFLNLWPLRFAHHRRIKHLSKSTFPYPVINFVGLDTSSAWTKPDFQGEFSIQSWLWDIEKEVVQRNDSKIRSNAPFKINPDTWEDSL